MTEISNGPEREAFDRVLSRLAESGFVPGSGYDDPEAVEGDLLAFSAIWCAGRDYQGGKLTSILTYLDAIAKIQEARLPALNDRITQSGQPLVTTVQLRGTRRMIEAELNMANQLRTMIREAISQTAAESRPVVPERVSGDFGASNEEVALYHGMLNRPKYAGDMLTPDGCEYQAGQMVCCLPKHPDSMMHSLVDPFVRLETP